MGSGFALPLAVMALAVACLQPSGAQTADSLGPGKFLVASRNLPDPNFSESVVVLLHYDNRGAVGLIINRPTEARVSALLKDVQEAKGREDVVYSGGPVALGGVRALRRVRARTSGSEPVFGDVYLVANKLDLQSALANGTKQSDIRVYAGYAGWGPGQLERELLMGAWHVMRADAASVFSARPETVWPRLIERTDLILAFLPGKADSRAAQHDLVAGK